MRQVCLLHHPEVHPTFAHHAFGVCRPSAAFPLGPPLLKFFKRADIIPGLLHGIFINFFILIFLSVQHKKLLPESSLAAASVLRCPPVIMLHNFTRTEEYLAVVN